MSDRVDTIRQIAAAHDTDGVLITHPDDVRWAVGFTGSNALLAVTESEARFATDGRYTAQAGAEVRGAEVEVAPGDLAEWAASRDYLSGARRVAVQSDRLTIAALRALEAAFPEIDFVPIPELLSEAVARKTDGDIDKVRRAQALTCAVFEALVPQLAVGATEREIAAEIAHQHLRRGASALSFDPIVASGPRGALPHARPTDRPLAAGDLVVIDMGGVLDGFCSDLTRTVAVGEPEPEARRAYEIVRHAHQAARDAARGGMTGRELDTVARSVIAEAGYGDRFSHSLGHGVGLDVHEWPRLSQQVNHRLPVGATVTIEPGIYVEGRFGIRIEDVIALRADGHDNLTPLPTDLIVLA